MKKNIFLAFAVIVVVVAAGLLGLAVGGFFNEPKVVANGIIISKKPSTDDKRLISSYEEYNELLKKYGANDVVLLTNNDFSNMDYIVDFINYEKNLNIKNISLDITDDGVNITYEVNKKPQSNKKYLMYFIPVEKGMLSEVKVNSQKFDVK